ncbi:MAG: tyrosine-type recombinase/integrase [Bacteroidota bacterium]
MSYLPTTKSYFINHKLRIRFSSRSIYLYCRITVDTVRCKNDFSVHLKVVPPANPARIKDGEWDVKNQRVKGESLDAVMVNSALDNIIITIKQYAHELNVLKKKYTADDLKRLYTGEDKTSYTFIEVSEKHIAHLEALPDDEIAKGTIKSYRSRHNNVVEFLQAKNYIHIQCYEFTPAIAQQFLLYMRMERELKVGQTFAAKNLDLVRKVIKFSINQGWNQFNPLQAFVNKKGAHKMPPFLNDEERSRIEAKVFSIPRLQKVKDSFVFLCHTGLSYIDGKRFRKEEHVVERDGIYWIDMSRIKTGIDFYVPLTRTAWWILNRYGDKLPMPCNQKFNGYLKEVQDLCRVETNLNSRIARTTFGVVMLNEAGMPLETVSRMLGHASVKITEKHYAKVLKQKMVRDVVNKNPIAYNYNDVP